MFVRLIFLFIFIQCWIQNSIAQQARAKICNWEDNKSGAVVLTFDDWTPGQYPVAVPELKARNLVGTFFVMLKSVDNNAEGWSQIKKTLDNGNEIANHTNNHPDLSKLNDGELDYEINGTASIIEKKLAPYKVYTFAYPFGVGAGQSVKDLKIQNIIKAKHIASRAVFPTLNYRYDFVSNEDDYFKIHTVGMDSTVKISQFCHHLNKVGEGGGLLVFMYHSLDDSLSTFNDNWYAQVKRKRFNEQLDSIKIKESKLWITTFSNAVKYHKEKNNAVLKINKSKIKSNWDIYISDNLENVIFDYPLTLLWDTNGKKVESVHQKDLLLEFEYLNDDLIKFKAIPDGGKIVIKEY